MPSLTVYNSNGYLIDVTINERVGSRQLTTGDKAKDTLLYVVQGPNDTSMDDVVVQNAIYNFTPAVYGQTLVFDHADTIEDQGGGIWYGAAKYVNPNNTQQTGKLLVAFDTAGAKQKVYVALNTTAYPTGSAAGYQNTIGCDGDKVEGVEIVIPQYKLALTYYVPNASVSTGYIGTLYSLTGTVNNGSFFGMNEGECLFLGAKGSRRGRGDWELSFEFAGSPNATGLTVGGISGVAKKGWQYLWTRFQKGVGGTGVNAATIQTALAVYVCDVYHETDFSTLGIGTNSPVFP